MSNFTSNVSFQKIIRKDKQAKAQEGYLKALRRDKTKKSYDRIDKWENVLKAA